MEEMLQHQKNLVGEKEKELRKLKNEIKENRIKLKQMERGYALFMGKTVPVKRKKIETPPQPPKETVKK